MVRILVSTQNIAASKQGSEESWPRACPAGFPLGPICYPLTTAKVASLFMINFDMVSFYETPPQLLQHQVIRRQGRFTHLMLKENDHNPCIEGRFHSVPRGSSAALLNGSWKEEI